LISRGIKTIGSPGTFKFDNTRYTGSKRNLIITNVRISEKKTSVFYMDHKTTL